MEKTVLYLRKSTKQQAASIPSQREECLAYAKRHGYTIVGEYIDEGVTGLDSIDRRPGFQSLLADAGSFDIVLAWDLSRITRSDPMRMMAELLPLRDAGVLIATTDKPEPRAWDFTQFLTDGIEGHSNNAELIKKSRGVLRGQANIARRGGWVQGSLPLAYSTVEEPCPELRKGVIKRLVLGDEDAVAAVRWAFDAYAYEGYSIADVRRGLDERGFRLTKPAVATLLKNPVYVGDFAWNKRRRGKIHSLKGGEIVERGDRKDRHNDRDDWVFIRDNHPAIVKRETFNKIQSSFARRQKATTPGGSRKFALTGLCRCGTCGRPMAGQMLSSGRVYYRCTGYTNGDTDCHSHSVGQVDVLAAVADSVRGWFSNPKMIKAVKDEAERQLRERVKDIDPSALKRRRSTLTRKLGKAEDRLLEVSQDMVARVESQIREIEEQIAAVDADIEATTTDIENALGQYDVTADDVLARLDRIDELIQNADGPTVREYLAEMFDSISVEVERVKTGKSARYHLAGGSVRLASTL